MTKTDAQDSALLREYVDRKIEQEINRKLSAIMTWDTTDVHIEVNNAIVHLTGSVADAKSLEQTVLVLFTVKGVKKIENKIRIRKEGARPPVNTTIPDMKQAGDIDLDKGKQQ